ncbi:MAG: TatD family hydrolase [Acutalibacteraceae bacterium]
MIFDSHAHYDDKAFEADRDELLSKLFATDVCGIINVGCNMETSKLSVELAQKYPLIWSSVGIHPHETENIPENYLGTLAAYLNHRKTVAIGEIGLDYHYDFSPREAQKMSFEEQLSLAKELDVPVIIHDREAHADTLELLKKYRPKGVVHCFSGSVEMSEEIIKLGMYIGLGGAVTFKNAKNPMFVAKAAPLDRILLETDCPYMAPVPHRGTRCDSSMIKFTAEKIAIERGISADELFKATNENAQQLFFN